MDDYGIEFKRVISGKLRVLKGTVLFRFRDTLEMAVAHCQGQRRIVVSNGFRYCTVSVITISLSQRFLAFLL